MSISPGHDDLAIESRPLVSIIIPALNEAANVPGLLARISELARIHSGYAFELVLIDDGSTDRTADLVLEQAGPAYRTTVVRLARRFGAHYAISAGLEQSQGDCAMVLGADMQEPLSLVADFLRQWESGSQVVWGVRRTRGGLSPTRKLASKAFSLLFTRYAHLENYPAEGPSGVLVDRCVIDEAAQMQERNRNVLALIAWLGFTQTRVEFDLLEREHGQSRWTTRMMIKLAVDSMIQFSSMPLRLFTFTGIGVAIAGLAYAILLIVRSLLGVETPAGWPTVLVILLVLGGMQLTVAGIMGEYLWRAVEETRRRPLFVVRDVRAAGHEHGTVHPRSPRHGRRMPVADNHAQDAVPVFSYSQPTTTRDEGA
jgi:polyisoprenyl-phosphate glycosyltransferase